MHRLFFADARNGRPVSTRFNGVTTADGRAQAEKPRGVRQQRSYDSHEDAPVLVSIMRYLQDVRVTVSSQCNAGIGESDAAGPTRDERLLGER